MPPIFPLIRFFILFALFTTKCTATSFAAAGGNGLAATNLRMNSTPTGVGGQKAFIVQSKSFGGINSMRRGSGPSSNLAFGHKFPAGLGLVAKGPLQNPFDQILLKKEKFGQFGTKAITSNRNAESAMNGHSQGEDDELLWKLTQKYGEMMMEMESGWLRDEMLTWEWAKWSEAVREAAKLLDYLQPAFTEKQRQINLENFLGYAKTVAIQQHISSVKVRICIVEELVDQCRKRLQIKREENGKTKEKMEKENFKLTPEEVECLLSHIELDELKADFLGVFGIMDDGNGKNLGNPKWIEWMVGKRIGILKEEMQMGKPFLQQIQPSTDYDVVFNVEEGKKARLAKEELAKTYQWLDRLNFLLTSFDYFRGWIQPPPRIPLKMKSKKSISEMPEAKKCQKVEQNKAATNDSVDEDEE